MVVLKELNNIKIAGLIVPIYKSTGFYVIEVIESMKTELVWAVRNGSEDKVLSVEEIKRLLGTISPVSL